MLAPAALAVLILAAFVLYRPALTGSFHFDDAPNLDALSTVIDLDSALAFVFGGDAGPLGRSIALASFLLQVEAWPQNPRPFLLTNLLIHLVNGVLIAALTYQLARVHSERIPRPALFAAVVAGLWLILPINATASLMVVQRMTTLAALFVLAGLVLYTLGRLRAASSPRTGLLLMTFGVVAFTPLAAFTKENGALLPLFALVLEATLLRGAAGPLPGAVRAGRALLLGIPTLLLAGYLISRIPPFADPYGMSPFGLYERLTTQALALLEYLHIAIAPTPSAITPFYDDYPLLGEHMPGLVGAALLTGWGVLVALAVWHRRRMAALSFAVLWFVAGHSLESTVLPLELFYLHRNYLPSYAIAFAIVWLFMARGTPIAPSLRLLLAPYMVLIALVLFETTTTWGDPDLAGELWLLDRPASIRAAEFLADRYRDRGDEAVANKIMRESFAKNPSETGAGLEALRTDCGETDPHKKEQRLTDINDLLKEGTFAKPTTPKLDSLVAAWERGQCPLLDAAALHAMLDNLFANEGFTRSGLQAHNLHLIRFRLHFASRSFRPAIASLEAAYARYPNNETLRLWAEVLASAGLRGEALDLIDSATPPRRANPVKAHLWREEIEALRAALQRPE